MRAWHKRTRFLFGETVTCIMLRQHNNRKLRNDPKQYAYEYVGPEHDYFLDLFAKDYTAFKQVIEEGKLPSKKFRRLHSHTATTLKPRLIALGYHALVNRCTAYLYYLTGIDALSLFMAYQVRNRSHLDRKLAFLQRKTGETTMKKQDMKQVIWFARQGFNLHEHS